MNTIAREPIKLTIQATRVGRAVYASPPSTYYIGHNYNIYRSDDSGLSWSHVCTMPRTFTRRCAELNRLACRLLRHEVRGLVRLSNGTIIAGNRKGVYYAEPGRKLMIPSRLEDANEQIMPPTTLSTGPDDIVIWGEYWSNKDRRHVNILASNDMGKSFHIAHQLPPGDSRHIHNILYDERDDVYWIFSGDRRHEAAIGRLSADFSQFEWVVRGKQLYRTVCAFDFGDYLVYGTDTEDEPNAIVRLDKATAGTERMEEIEGSVIYGCRFGGLYAFTTTVEPSSVNACRDAVLWVSRDGISWTRAYRATKDRWNEKYFQFGSICLPRGQTDSERILFSGQALKSIDNKIVVADINYPIE